MADVLMVNMWAQDVGRYAASNYGLLKVIFEVNLKLFDNHQLKKLCFVLRDYDPRIAAEKLRENILNDINNIWSEIQKPEQHEDKVAGDFFEFDFAIMPHKIFQADKF